MKVSELKEILADIDDDVEVVLFDYGNIIFMPIIRVETHDLFSSEYFGLGVLETLKSQLSSAKKDVNEIKYAGEYLTIT